MYLNPQCCVCFSGYGEGQFEKGRTTVFCFHHFHSLFFQKLISSFVHTHRWNLWVCYLFPFTSGIEMRVLPERLLSPLKFYSWYNYRFHSSSRLAIHNTSLPMHPGIKACHQSQHFSLISVPKETFREHIRWWRCSCFFSFSQGAEVINSGSYWRHLGLIGGFKINNPYPVT